jgi:hypothetical protein
MNVKFDRLKKLLVKKNVLILGSVLILSIALFIFFYLIKSDSDDTNNQKNSGENNKEKDTLFIEIEKFSENKFNEGIEQKLLEEIGMCDTLIDGYKLPCSPSFFKFFKLNIEKKLSDGFILLVNSRAFKDSNSFFTQRRLFVFEREKGKLVQVNRFKANLVELRKSKTSGYYEMLLRFRDSKKTVFYCSYRWDNRKYSIHHCEEIGELGDRAPRKVKIDLRKSVADEVKSILTDEKLAF